VNSFERPIISARRPIRNRFRLVPQKKTIEIVAVFSCRGEEKRGAKEKKKEGRRRRKKEGESVRKEGGKEKKKGRRGGAQARLLGCCLVVFRSTCMCAVATHRRIRHQAGGAITMAITHPPFASFSRAAPHSPPTSLGAAASALPLSPCLSFFLFRGAAFLKF
jgi:hypothetical protein